MNESAAHENLDRYKIATIILTLITTIATAVIATLQADANIRANNANRDSQYYAILVSTELHRSGLKSSYDLNTFSKILLETQTDLMMQFTALQSENNQSIALSDINSLAAQARASQLTSFSVFYTDPRYEPKTTDGAPDMEAYLADSSSRANEILLQQNAAADEYHNWSRKADSYVGVLTVLAVSFFLFGLAQALKEKMRLLFDIFGAFILFSGIGWAFLIMIS